MRLMATELCLIAWVKPSASNEDVGPKALSGSILINLRSFQVMVLSHFNCMNNQFFGMSFFVWFIQVIVEVKAYGEVDME